MHRYLISICALSLVILIVLSVARTTDVAGEDENNPIGLTDSAALLAVTNRELAASSVSKQLPKLALFAAQLPNRTNVALASNGAVATASSTTSPSEGLGNYEPISAINGERLAAGTGASYSNNTFWRDGTADVYPDWWQVNFQGQKTIDEIDVYTLQDNYTNPSEPTESMTFTQYGITSFDVQFWNGSTWATVPGGQVTNNNNVWRRFFFSPVTTDRIRVLVNNALFGRSRLVEVEAWGINALNNLALARTATQSSTFATGSASLAVDGNTSGNYFDNSVTHTAFNTNAWWQVDLGGVQSIGQIKVWNRTDCCPSRLSNFYVLVSDGPFSSTDLTATLNQAGVSAYYTPGQAGTPTTISVGRTGQYVRVQLAGTDYLSLAEVEVIGDSGVNVARSSNGAVATASSVHVSGNYPVAAVNNGDRKAANWGNGGGWNDNTQGDYSSDIVQVNFPAFNFLSEIDVFTLRDNFQDNQTPPTLTETFNTCENTGNGITEFEVQYWTGAMWVTLPGGLVRDNNKVWRQLVFPEVWSSAVRVQVHGAARWTIGNNYSRIIEIEAYGRTAGFNLARASNGSVAVASSQFNANYPVSAVNDGDRTGYNWGRGGFGSGWNDATQNEYSIDWVRVDFAGGQARRISEIDVYTLRDGFSTKTDDPTIYETFATADNSGQGMTDYDVQYLAGGVWRLAPGGKVTNNDKVRRQLKFSPITTSAIRVAVNKGANFTAFANNWSRIVEIEAWENNAAPDDFVWVGDALPAGAIPTGSFEGWNWTCSNPLPLSGTLAHSSDLITGVHQHYFYNATQTLTVNTGDILVAHVYLDPVNPPTQVMLQWNDGTWEHRAYWGQNQIGWGVDGTVSRRNMGVLPPAGQWVRLEVPASLVGLEGRVLNGMAFTLFNGRATWDHGAKVAAASQAPPTISIGDVTVTEGNSGSVSAVFNVTLSSSSTQSISVNYATANGSAISPSDYTAASGTVTFAPGETTKGIPIQVLSDTTVESNETFSVNLSSPVNATIADGQGVGTINNDDTASPAIAISDVSVAEGQCFETNAVFGVTLSPSSSQTVTVNFATSNGSAITPGDYIAANGTLTFLPGETSKSVGVGVIGEHVVEGNETFVVNLSNPVNATIADGQGQGTILNDDPGTTPAPSQNSSGQWSQWSLCEDLATVPVHISLLPDSRLLYWGRDKGSDGWDVSGGCSTYTWDPVTKAKSVITNFTTNLFCSGHSFLPDGRLLVTGGHDKYASRPEVEGIGDKNVNIFDYRTNMWNLGPKMENGRWYPSVATLANGETAFFTGTFWNGGFNGQIPDRDGNQFPDIYAPDTPRGTTQPSSAGLDIRPYPFVHLGPDGRVFINAVRSSWYFDRFANQGTGEFTVLTVPDNPNDPNDKGLTLDHLEGSSVLYDSVNGKIIVIGGRQFIGNANSALVETEMINLSGAPQWNAGPAMNFKRQFLNATLLPDGKVLATGGTQCGGNTVSIDCPEGAATFPELWNPPATGTGGWTVMAENPTRIPRVYHSMAILLPDARVLVGGGGLPAATGYVTRDANGVQLTCSGVVATQPVECKKFGYNNVEIFSPPYLFTASGSPAARPTINSAPATVALGETFNVGITSSSTVNSVALMRLPSVTHGITFDQRRVVLVPQAPSTTNLTLTMPAEGTTVCPPGPYMLFIINQNGTPSVAKMIQVTSTSTPVALPDVGGRVVRNRDGRLQTFYRGADGGLYYTTQTSPGSTSWSSHVNLGAFLSVNPVAIADTAGRLHVFISGPAPDNSLFHQWQVTPGGTWSGWQTLGTGARASSDLAVARNVNGRLQVFYRGIDNALHYVVQTSQDPNAWGADTSLGGGLTSAPAVGINGDGRLEVFVRGTDNGLYHIWQDTPAGNWLTFFPMGGFINSSQVAVDRNPDGSLQVFYRGGDNALYFLKQLLSGPGGWSQHTSLGGALTSDPTIGVNGDGRLEVFVRGTDNGLQHIWQTTPGGNWSPWHGLGGFLTSKAAPARNADGRMSVVVRGANNVLYYNSQPLSGPDWTGFFVVGGNASTF